MSFRANCFFKLLFSCFAHDLARKACNPAFAGQAFSGSCVSWQEFSSFWATIRRGTSLLWGWNSIVSDNLRAGVSKACFYEPAINRTYAEMAAHYGTAVVPARPRKPRDKAKVEVAVQVATRFIVAKLRHQRFFSLAELNAAIRDLVVQLNNRVTRHLGTSRRALFEEIERPALKALPVEPYTYAEWKQCKVSFNYHVEVEPHYYSVPHTLVVH